MPMYAFRCAAGHTFERYLPVTQFREKVRCPVEKRNSKSETRNSACGRTATLVLVSSRSAPAQGFSPVVIHRRPDGHVSFPAHAQAPLREGYQRVELRTMDEVRKFEGEVNAREFRKHVEHKEREEMAFGQGRAERQAELRQLAQHMSPMGRDFARVAMEASNRKSRSRDASRFEAGFHVQAFSDDRSSLADYRDKATGWKSKR